MMKKNVALILCLVLAIGAFVGCAGGTTPAPQSSSESANSTAALENSKASADGGMTAMIVVIPQGDPFLQIAYSGVIKFAEETGKEAKIIEALDKSEYTEQVRAMAEAGANPIYVVWDDLAEVAFGIAPDFPDTKFIAVDSYATSDLPNVMTVVVEPQIATFVSGVVAARTTQSKKVAWVGNMDLPIVNRARYGFEAGVKYADPSVSVESIYIGDSGDPNKGAELTKQLISKGADVIMQTANQAGMGVIRACEEMEVKAIGFDEWQGYINPDIVFWSALKDTAGATYSAGKSVTDDTFKSGITVFGLNAGATIFDQRDYDKLSDELKKEVDDVVAMIMSGEIEVPKEG